MKSECSRQEYPALSPCNALDCVWRVDVGPAYDVSPPVGGNALIAIRTLEGEGELQLRNRPLLFLKRDTVIVIQQSELLRYRCSGERWFFFWFQFAPSGTLPLPFERIVEIQDSSEESAERKRISRELRSPAPGAGRMASARFGLLLCCWAATVEAGKSIAHPHRQRIERVIEEMNRRLGEAWTVESMAKVAGLSERRFRQVFPEIAAEAPKRFYDRLRLQQARELLQNGICNVGEAADQLGFSSPFHFSKAFRKEFGMPPSAFRYRS
jgi:AraC-like DNA-binding protein